MEKLPRLTVPVVIGIIFFIILVAKSSVTIGSGHAGVLYKTFGNGVVTDEPPLGEGFHIIAPWNKVFVYEVRQQELSDKMQVLSSNGLEIRLDASAWYHPVYSDVAKLHQEKGENYLERVIKPAIRSAARSVVGRYTPEQLYSSKRDAIQDEIFIETKKILDKQFIELKLRQEQESLEYEFRLEKASKEAEKVRIEAQGKADANLILSASLTDKVLKDKGIDATLELSKSPNTKVIVIGSGEGGLPIILGDN